MKYVNDTLISGERVLREGRFHWTYSLGAVLLICTVIGAIFGLPMLIRKWTTEIAITSTRLVYKRGWIVRTVEEIALNRLEETLLRQNLGERIFNVGRVRVRGLGTGDISLPAIVDPVGFRKALLKAQAALE